MPSKTVSRKLLKRLPLYLNYLKSLPEGFQNVSATAMAKALELGDVQVRKDLAKVSGTGRRRTGRNRHQLMQDIESYLSFAEETGTIVVGAGKLGRALLDYVGFEEAGFKLKELIIKEQHNCKATGYWKTNSVKFNFLLIAHEYLFIFRK